MQTAEAEKEPRENVDVPEGKTVETAVAEKLYLKNLELIKLQKVLKKLMIKAIKKLKRKSLWLKLLKKLLMLDKMMKL